MATDFNVRNFPYADISIPSECPFFPVIFNDAGEKKARFNQGYVLDYQSFDSEKKSIKVIPVSMEDSYAAAGSFFVKILTPPDSAQVTGAILVTGEMDATNEFHYSAQVLEGLSVYTDGVGNFQMPLCTFGTEGSIENIYLRDNIHWQKINFANQPLGTGEDAPANSFGVLYNWGEGTQFNDNPTVKFARIEQKRSDGEFPNGKEKIIKLERSVLDEGNIVVTTQFPEIPDDETSVLVREYDNTWKWLNPQQGYAQLLVYNGTTDRMQFFDVHEGCFFYVKDNIMKMLEHPVDATTETPYYLQHDGNEPFWAVCNCSGDYS